MTLARRLGWRRFIVREGDAASAQDDGQPVSQFGKRHLPRGVDRNGEEPGLLIGGYGPRRHGDLWLHETERMSQQDDIARDRGRRLRRTRAVRGPGWATDRSLRGAL